MAGKEISFESAEIVRHVPYAVRAHHLKTQAGLETDSASGVQRGFDCAMPVLRALAAGGRGLRG